MKQASRKQPANGLDLIGLAKRGLAPRNGEGERMKIGDATPWGPAQNVDEVAPGIVFVSTASHGGFKLDAEKLAAVPPAWLAASFNLQGKAGWFEEDCDWCMVGLTFPDEVAAYFGSIDVKKAAAETFRYFIAKKLGEAA
jgi:hypothetical protein